MQRLQWAALLNVGQSAPVVFYQSAPVCGEWLSPAHSLRRWRYCVHGFTLALLPATNAEQRTEPAVSFQQWVWLSPAPILWPSLVCACVDCEAPFPPFGGHACKTYGPALPLQAMPSHQTGYVVAPTPCGQWGPQVTLLVEFLTLIYVGHTCRGLPYA
jgi:hypothetical protein